MTFLTGVPIPIPNITTGVADWWGAVAVIIVFAIAVTVALVLNNRPSKVKPAITEEPAETYQKAA